MVETLCSIPVGTGTFSHPLEDQPVSKQAYYRIDTGDDKTTLKLPGLLASSSIAVEVKNV